MTTRARLLRGEVSTDQAVAEVTSSDANGMEPIVRVSVRKAAGSPRWGGFIQSIGEDSILQ